MKKGGKSKYVTERFDVKGMVCGSCEKIITKQALGVKGVKEVKVDYTAGVCEVTYDPAKTSLNAVKDAIEAKGYSCAAGGASSNGLKDILPIAAVAIILLGAYLLVEPTVESYVPQIGKDASIPLLFIVGLFTGFHCIAMCGGFVISYSTQPGSDYKSHIKYGLSKTLSYTFFGAIFGLIGSFVAFTPMLRGAAAILAGLFLMLFGLNMLGLIRFRLQAPAFMDKWVSGRLKGNKGPVAIGLLNGLMIACGPLQAIYLMAAASGSPYYGALYLAAFGLGTLPVLLGFGVITSALSFKMTNKILRYSGIIVVLLGLIMVNRGIALTGSGYDVNTLAGSAQPATTGSAASSGGMVTLDSDGYQVIRMNVTSLGWQPDTFVLAKGVPVRWVIDGQQITSCNSAIQVPKYNLKFNLNKGLQTIEFTPTEAGTVPWSCWMGMIPGKFIVRDDLRTVRPGEVNQPVQSLVTSGNSQNDYATSTTQPAETGGGQDTAPPAVGSGDSVQTIHMNVTASGWQPNKFVLKKGIPVKWTIDGQQLTGCNSGINVPSLGLQFNIKPGLQTIEFTPTESGNIQWSCLMGMIQGVFVVKDDINTTNAAQVQKALNDAPTPSSGGGRCGCGMM